MGDSLIPPRVVGAPDPDADPATDPELAALLQFAPAPRQVNRPDGWTPERQRTFIHLIVVTGSPQRAAAAMKKVLSGAEGVYRAEGAEGFRAAWDGAVEMVRTREERRLKALGAHSIPEPPHRRPRPSPAPVEGAWADAPGPNCALGDPMFDRIVHNYFRKLDGERRARLAGDVAAADLYLRQLTWIEVALDIASSGGALAQFEKLRLKAAVGGWDCHPIQVAETAASRLLDQARRIYWEASGDPERPALAPGELLHEHEMIGPDGRALTVWTERHNNRGGTPEQLAARKKEREEQMQQLAQQQISWEAKARQTMPSPPSGDDRQPERLGQFGPDRPEPKAEADGGGERGQ